LLNVHFHAIFLDGDYQKHKDDTLTYHEISESLTPDDMAWAVRKIADRSISAMKKLGLLDDGADPDNSEDLYGIGLCDGASIKNMIAYGERAGKPVRRIRLKIDPNAEVKSSGQLIAEIHGFNLKADRVVKGHQRWKLARLVRYVARPPLATTRLTLCDDGKSVRYAMKRPWSDGTTEVLLSGVELIEKLAAAVPPPRGHLVRYVGIFAPNSKLRAKVVQLPKPKARDENGKMKSSTTARATWAKLMMRAFGFDLTRCAACGGEVKAIAVIANPRLATAILQGIARPPPERVTTLHG
jgi:hypothetical protein